MALKPTRKPLPRPTIGQAITAVRHDIELLERAIDDGVRDQRHFDELEAAFVSICDRGRAAFRGAR